MNALHPTANYPVHPHINLRELKHAPPRLVPSYPAILLFVYRLFLSLSLCCFSLCCISLYFAVLYFAVLFSLCCFRCR